jgi:hypothetical protein
MKVLKLFVIALFAAVFASALVQTRTRIRRPTEAPAGFDNQTNGFEPQGTPVPPNTDPVPGDFESDKFIFDVVDVIDDGLGPVYNAQSCAECHQNPVTGAISQINELRAGRLIARLCRIPCGGLTFSDAPGGSLIQHRAVDPSVQERVPDGSRIVCGKNGGTMFLMGFDGGQYGEVVNAPTGAMAGAAFSNDGRKYVFATADSTGSIQIFTHERGRHGQDAVDQLLLGQRRSTPSGPPTGRR